MLPLFHQRTFGFGYGAVYVFWALILFDPQPSYGILNGGWVTLFEHYGRNLKGLEASTGDVLQKTNNDLILIFDNQTFFQMQSMEPEPGRTEIQCHLYLYPHNYDQWPGLLKKVRPPNNLGVTFALATRFTDKYLPFHPVYCNRGHYMRYILYGEITQSAQFKECPLAAPMASVTVGKVKTKYFKLMDSDGERHDFSEYAESKEQRLFARAESVNQIARRNSWYQRGNFYKNMLRDILLCGRSRIRKSSSKTILKRVKLKASKGQPPLRYRIELVDKSTINEAASFMHKHYARRNNLASSVVYDSDDEMDEQTDLNLWMESLEEGFALGAFLEDKKGNRGPMIGCSIMELIEKDSKKTNDVSPEREINWEIYRSGMDTIGQTLEDLKSNVDVFSLYNCSSYLKGSGLTVAEDYGGRGIATELLRARGEVCRMVGTPVDVTVFDGVASQRVAEKCGYITLSEIDLRTYKIYGQIAYKNPQTPVIKFMGKQYY